MKQRFFLALFAMVGCAFGASADPSVANWNGEYESLSHACGEGAITIREDVVSSSECEAIKVHVLAASDGQLAFEVPKTADCSWKGEVISLTREKDNVSAGGFVFWLRAHDDAARYKRESSKGEYAEGACAYSKK